MVTRFLALLLVGIVVIIPGRALAQEEVASGYFRYSDREMSTGYYEEHEVRPRGQGPFIQAPGITRRGMRYRTDDRRAWNRRFLADSHIDIPNYEIRRCESCHVDHARNTHTVRDGISCRQCHSSEPIASINHYYASMNPVRRHAYVCAKCHEGASASFATYVVHSPSPGATGTAEVFPELYYTYMALALLTLGTLAVFIPHTFLWGLRELIPRLRNRSKEHHE